MTMTSRISSYGRVGTEMVLRLSVPIAVLKTSGRGLLPELDVGLS